MKAGRNGWRLLLCPIWKGKAGQPNLLGLVIIFVGALNLAACGLQTDTITISYLPQGDPHVLPGASDTVVDVQVVDVRSNKNEVSKKGDEYDFLAPILVGNDVAQVLRNATEAELQNRGFELGEGGAIVFAELSKFYNRFRASNSEAEVFIHVQVKTTQGDLIYSEIVDGKGINPDIALRSGKNAKIALEAALRDAVNSLVTNVEFHSSIIDASEA